MTDKNWYGQNKFQGPSSDTPGKKTVSGFLPEADLGKGNAVASSQTRDVGKSNVPNAFGMTGPKPSPKI